MRKMYMAGGGSKRENNSERNSLSSSSSLDVSAPTNLSSSDHWLVSLHFLLTSKKLYNENKWNNLSNLIASERIIEISIYSRVQTSEWDLMQMICTQLYSFKYSHLIPIIIWFLFNNSHLFAHRYIYLPTPLLKQDVTQGQFIQRSLTGLNSEFYFS